MSRWRTLIRSSFLSLSLWWSLPSHAQSPMDVAAFSRVTTAKPLRNGVQIEDGPMLLQATALQDDIVRVRASRNRTLPEDASWAVLPEARNSTVTVTQDVTVDSVGFHTATLRFGMERSTGLITVADNAGHILRKDARPLEFHEHSFRLSEVMPDDEHYFGLGDKMGPSDRRNRAFTLWNTDAYRFQESTDPLYKSIPFFLAYRSGTAVGTLLDNTWRSSFDFGKEFPNSYSFGASDGPIDFYIIGGPSPRQVVEGYAWLTGKPPLPPMWILGFQQSRYSYTPQARLMEVANRLRADHIPCDALYLDIDFQDRNRPFTVNTDTFPSLQGALEDLRAKNFHVVAITDLHIAQAPDQGYAPYDTGIAGDDFVHNPDGSIYTGPVWPGPSVFPDFTRTAVREWWGGLYIPFLRLGFAGFWNDMNEPSVFNTPTATMPLRTVHRIQEKGFIARDATHAELHNVYGMENSRATYDGLRKLQPDVRPFVLTRASYAGGQRYAVTWTGDDSSTWNHLRMTTPMLKSLGLSGFSFAGADVGGFAGTATPDLLTKWFEVGAFQPIDRDHSEKGTGDQEPWVGGPEQENIRRRYIEERYRLMPYLYTLAEETVRTGLPMERPLFLDYPEATADRHPMDLDPGVDAEFLLGHDLLIAPSPFPEAPDAYTVEFPSDAWFDYWTGKRVERHTATPNPEANAPASASVALPLTAQVVPTLESLPVYVRAGAILPIAPLVQSTEEIPQGLLTLRVYVGDDCKGSLYADDGKSLAYTRGEFLRMSFTCAVNANGLQVKLSAHEGAFKPWWKGIRLEVYGWTPVHSEITQNGKALGTALAKEDNRYVLTLADIGKGSEILLN